MNALVGYLLLHNDERGTVPVILFSVAMSFKFLINDHALHEAHHEKYDRSGRLLLAAAVLGGAGIRVGMRLPDAAPVVLQSVLAGAIIFNVLKEELPDPSNARYGVFLAGGIGYAVVLVLV